MNTLNIIQKLAKAGRIFSKIIRIACTVGGILCVVGAITLAVIPHGIKVGGVEIHALIESSASVSIGTCYTLSLVGLIFCISETMLAKLAETYFIHELEAGTPFTLEGAAEMKQLGIYIVGVSFTAVVVATIVHAIMSRVFTNVADLHLSDYSSIGIGIAFIVLSLFCRYAAEQLEVKVEKRISDR